MGLDQLLRGAVEKSCLLWLYIQRVVMTLSSSVVTRPVCVYHNSTCVMAGTTAETGPTNSTAVSHILIVLSTHMQWSSWCHCTVTVLCIDQCSRKRVHQLQKRKTSRFVDFEVVLLARDAILAQYMLWPCVCVCLCLSVCHKSVFY